MPTIPQPFSHKPISEWLKQFQQSEAAELRLQALQAIGLLAEAQEASRIAAQALSDPDPTIRALSAKQLSRPETTISADTEQKLLALLLESDPDARFESARTLVRRHSPQTDQVLPVLLAFLDEPETQPLMLAAVITIIAELNLDPQIACQQVQPRLTPYLEHDRAEVREAVASSFARWPQMAESIADRLLPLLDDSEPVVREKVADTLGQLGSQDDAILQALSSASQDEDPEVARVAAEALRRLAQKLNED